MKWQISCSLDIYSISKFDHFIDVSKFEVFRTSNPETELVSKSRRPDFCWSTSLSQLLTIHVSLRGEKKFLHFLRLSCSNCVNFWQLNFSRVKIITNTNLNLQKLKFITYKLYFEMNFCVRLQHKFLKYVGMKKPNFFK